MSERILNLQSEQNVDLEKIKIGIYHRVEGKLIDCRVDVSEYEGFVCDAVDAKLTGFLWGERGEPLIIEYPENWIEGIKARWFPAWLKKRFPVRLVSHSITTRTLYPHFRISLKKETSLLKWDHRRSVLTDPLNEEDLFE